MPKHVSYKKKKSKEEILIFLKVLVSDVFSLRKFKLSIMRGFQNWDISNQNKTGRYKMIFEIDISDDDAF